MTITIESLRNQQKAKIIEINKALAEDAVYYFTANRSLHIEPSGLLWYNYQGVRYSTFKTLDDFILCYYGYQESSVLAAFDTDIELDTFLSVYTSE